jgi:hypothetical protein
LVTDGKAGGSKSGPPNRIYRRVIGDDQPMDVAWLLEWPQRKIIFGADHFAHPLRSTARLG